MQVEKENDKAQKDKDYLGVLDIDVSKIKPFILSDTIKDDDIKNKMLVLEGIIKVTEQRIMYYLNK